MQPIYYKCAYIVSVRSFINIDICEPDKGLKGQGSGGGGGTKRCREENISRKSTLPIICAVNAWLKK
jgi:hypothetical protein